MKKREAVPMLIAVAAALLFLIVVLNLPSMKLLGVDWRIALFAALAVLTYKIFRWSQGLFGEMPP